MEQITTNNLSPAPKINTAETIPETAENVNTIASVTPESKPTSKPRKAKFKKNQPRTPKQVNILTIKDNHPELTTRDIAAKVECNQSYVVQVLQRYGLNAETVKDYRNNRADILAGLQHRIVNSITEDDIQKAPLAARMMAIGISYDKERLERGQSSQNISLLINQIETLQVEGNAVDAGS